MGAKARKEEAPVMGDNPLEGEQLLLDALYGTMAPSKRVPSKRKPPPKVVDKPQHYKIVSISLYLEDIERLEAHVNTLKKRGHTKANKSQVIRQALALLDLDKVEKAP